MFFNKVQVCADDVLYSSYVVKSRYCLSTSNAFVQRCRRLPLIIILHSNVLLLHNLIVTSKFSLLYQWLSFPPEFTGLEDHIKSFWMLKASDDIWRGSLKHEDWKPVKTAIPNGAWEPKLRKVKTKKAKGRGARPKGIEAMGNLVNGTGMRNPGIMNTCWALVLVWEVNVFGCFYFLSE